MRCTTFATVLVTALMLSASSGALGSSNSTGKAGYWAHHSASYWHYHFTKAHHAWAVGRRQMREQDHVIARLMRLHRGTVFDAIHLASAAFGVSYSDMVTVARCESSFNPSERDPSTASGLFQFLDSTWSSSGLYGFSVFDPYANALAAARLVYRDGGWREWTCKP